MEKLKTEIRQAVDAFKSGRILEAEDLTKKLISRNPKVPFLYNLMGLILSEQKEADQALEYYEKGIEIDPNFAEIYNNLGILFTKIKLDNNKAEKFYKKSISLNYKLSEAHNNLGNLYKKINKFNEAVKCYKKAIETNSKTPFAHHNLANAYVSSGNFEEAKKYFIESIKLFPDFYVSHRSLSRLIKYTNNHEHLLQLNKIYETINVDKTEHGADLAFALGKAHEDVKDFDKSFKFYDKANALHRKKINFSLEKQKEKFDEIKDTFNKNLFKKYDNSGLTKFSPIFIVGMSRSGTTLIEQILSSHPKVFGADEVEFIPNLIKKNFGRNKLKFFFDQVIEFNKDDLRKIGKEYQKMINTISNNSERTTDKLPVNFLSIGFIKLILPNSKIIHTYRNPKDNCFSIFKNHFPDAKIKYAYDMNEIVMYYNLYFDLMKYWNNLLPDFIYNLKYENLVSNFDSESKNLLNFCNLEWSDDCLNFHTNKRIIKTASDVQARNKLYSSSINSWRNYKNHLEKYFTKLNI